MVDPVHFFATYLNNSNFICFQIFQTSDATRAAWTFGQQKYLFVVILTCWTRSHPYSIADMARNYLLKMWIFLFLGSIPAENQFFQQFAEDTPATTPEAFPAPFSSELIDKIKALKATGSSSNKDRTARVVNPPARSHSANSFRGSLPTVPLPEARDFFNTDEGSDNEDSILSDVAPSADNEAPTTPQVVTTRRPFHGFPPKETKLVRLQSINPVKAPMTASLSRPFVALDDTATGEIVQKVKAVGALNRLTVQLASTRRRRTKTTTTLAPTTTTRATTTTLSEDEQDADASTDDDPAPAPKPVNARGQKTAAQLSLSENVGEKKTLVVGKQAAALEQLTKSLVSRFGMTVDQIRNQLPLITMSKTVKQDCLTTAEGKPQVPLNDPFGGEVPDCAQSKFRSFDGTCNNIAFPNRGTTASIFLRMVEPDYADSIAAPRKSKGGQVLPSARVISKRVAGNADVPSTTTTQMFMQFGQFIDHDITNTPKARGLDKLPPQCCFDDPKTKLDPACFPIPIPKDDVFLGPLNQTCMEFVRSLPGTRPGCTLGPREQVNQNTAFIDGSAIYGLSQDKADALRSHETGQLKTFVPKNHPHYFLLPQNPKNAECIDPNETKMCFKAGDSRANVHLGIAQAQTLWLRQHNRNAEALHALNAHWTDEKLFHEARHITVAQLQHITYNEFLPVLLGDQMLDKWDLRLLNTGRLSKYNISLHPGILNEFATAAYRVGHTMVQNSFRRTSKDYQFRGGENLKTTFFHPFALYDKDAFDELILGMVSSPSQEVDNNFVDELSNHLFEIPGDAFGLDLTALNIQRGRDHGIAGWMKWRQLCGLPTAANFDELRAMNIMPLDIVGKMEDNYDDVADVDLYIAGTAETHVPGGKVGPTFACIIADQFRRLRIGDRFWYENDLPLSSSLSDRQVEAIRTTTMSRILCDNTPLMETIQPHAFLLPDEKTNPLVPCSSILSPNLRRWKVRRARKAAESEEE
ncbi:Chorion peroxidase [Hypsibius exemplaris]|uniref:Chorion peroxidase n=1 Tax=Hypsibius exemplaris TaxID=2072580 RepID=A0A1W0X000_HYPEX|nr:Chorion peroxidase [Hypsibius exemplaris]